MAAEQVKQHFLPAHPGARFEALVGGTDGLDLHFSLPQTRGNLVNRQAGIGAIVHFSGICIQLRDLVVAEPDFDER